MKKTGIYKITSPSGKVYIGQSIDIDKRLKKYKRLDCRKQYVLLSSLKKYGFDNHIFEILILCEESQLNELERYYQDLYSVLGQGGMNLRLTEANDRCGQLSNEIKEKISKNRKGKYFLSETEKLYLSNLHKGKKRDKSVGIKISELKKGIIFSKEHKLKLSIAKKGRKLSAETRMNMKKTAEKKRIIINNKIEETIKSVNEFITNNNNNCWIHREKSRKPIIKANIMVKITGIDTFINVWWHFNKFNISKFDKSIVHFHIKSFEDFLNHYNKLLMQYS